MNKVIYILLFISIIVMAKPMTEFSANGMYFRIYNPDDRAYYCMIWAGDEEYEKIVYPGQYTRWYSMRGGYSWDCES